ncbi:MAG: aminopeptidase [Chloroflexi bacterium]|nr:aminopeptidase [Chloroflexota bacterium]
MSAEFEGNLEKYAQVIVKVGSNLQPGQRLMITTPLAANPLVRQVAKAAYQAGARYVGVNWDDEELQRIRVQHAALETMTETDTWNLDGIVDYFDHGDATLRISAQNPDLLSGLDSQKVQAKQRAEAEQRHNVLVRIAANATNWLVAGASTPGWATKVFPDLAAEAAVARLWDAIFQACRIDQPDPVAVWERHIADLGKRAAYLNGKQYSALHYTAPGTDLTVGLPAGHIWGSAKFTAQNGISFVANVPTEEVFTLPHKDRIDGVVTATKPLSYGGSLITDFTLKFTAGHVVEATAKSGQAALDSILNTDDASRSLGEVALVPHSSPISQSGLLFYNTLFDENASDHLALGNAYRFTLEDGVGMTDEAFAAAGGNTSRTHVDFMIGSGMMNIDGITADGAAEPVMRKGEWAFDG